jgi:hypothetical protein
MTQVILIIILSLVITVLYTGHAIAQKEQQLQIINTISKSQSQLTMSPTPTTPSPQLLSPTPEELVSSRDRSIDLTLHALDSQMYDIKSYFTAKTINRQRQDLQREKNKQDFWTFVEMKKLVEGPKVQELSDFSDIESDFAVDDEVRRPCLPALAGHFDEEEEAADVNSEGESDDDTQRTRVGVPHGHRGGFAPRRSRGTGAPRSGGGSVPHRGVPRDGAASRAGPVPHVRGGAALSERAFAFGCGRGGPMRQQPGRYGVGRGIYQLPRMDGERQRMRFPFGPTEGSVTSGRGTVLGAEERLRNRVDEWMNGVQQGEPEERPQSRGSTISIAGRSSISI